MHFKSAVLLLGLYFLTSTRSIGLNSQQLSEVDKQYKNLKKTTNQITGDNFAPIIEKLVGIEESKKLSFNCDPDMSDVGNFKQLLLAVAYTDKKPADSFEVPMITPFEADIFLGTFMKNVELVTLPRPSSRLEQVPITDIENTKVFEKMEIAMQRLVRVDETDGEINPAEFLLFMLKNKPQGYGLNLAQVEKLQIFYGEHKTKTGLDRQAVTKFFRELGLIDRNTESKTFFESNRPAAKELIELMLITAERSTAPVRKEEEDAVMDLNYVSVIIQRFNELDADNSGALNGEEWLKTKENIISNIRSVEENKRQMLEKLNYPTNNPPLTSFDYDGDGEINIAEFFKMSFSIIKSLKEEDTIKNSINDRMINDHRDTEPR